MKTLRRALALVLVLGLLVGVGALWFHSLLRPTDPGPALFVRFERSVTLEQAVDRLAENRLVRSPGALKLYARLRRRTDGVASGTYEFRGGMTAGQLLGALRRPVRRMVRIPEGWWIRRVAQRLEREGIVAADDYIAAANDPDRFREKLPFALPRGSLEGYLFPDTYDVPPLTTADEIVLLQLRTFGTKVVDRLPAGADIPRLVNIGAMVELEAALPEERAKVAGVIENRLGRRMRLEIDATVLYALQEWKVLGPGVVRTVRSPYNTYLHGGLPPGPIGSPSWASIEAALNPAEHSYLFYVARPDRSHYFSASYPEHLANIRRARSESKTAEAAR